MRSSILVMPIAREVRHDDAFLDRGPHLRCNGRNWPFSWPNSTCQPDPHYFCWPSGQSRYPLQLRMERRCCSSVRFRCFSIFWRKLKHSFDKLLFIGPVFHANIGKSQIVTPLCYFFILRLSLRCVYAWKFLVLRNLLSFCDATYCRSSVNIF